MDGQLGRPSGARRVLPRRAARRRAAGLRDRAYRRIDARGQSGCTIPALPRRRAARRTSSVPALAARSTAESQRDASKLSPSTAAEIGFLARRRGGPPEVDGHEQRGDCRAPRPSLRGAPSGRDDRERGSERGDPDVDRKDVPREEADLHESEDEEEEPARGDTEPWPARRPWSGRGHGGDGAEHRASPQGAVPRRRPRRARRSAPAAALAYRPSVCCVTRGSKASAYPAAAVDLARSAFQRGSSTNRKSSFAATYAAATSHRGTVSRASRRQSRRPCASTATAVTAAGKLTACSLQSCPTTNVRERRGRSRALPGGEPVDGPRSRLHRSGDREEGEPADRQRVTRRARIDERHGQAGRPRSQQASRDAVSQERVHDVRGEQRHGPAHRVDAEQRPTRPERAERGERSVEREGRPRLEEAQHVRRRDVRTGRDVQPREVVEREEASYEPAVGRHVHGRQCAHHQQQPRPIATRRHLESQSTGVTSTATVMRCAPPPRTTPCSGLTSP